jgi:hypothetical protein
MAPTITAPRQRTENSETQSPLQYLSPPQSGGMPRRLYTEGAPAGEEKINVALKALRDPVALNTFSRNYSGQRRGWTR